MEIKGKRLFSNNLIVYDEGYIVALRKGQLFKIKVRTNYKTKYW